MEEIRIRLVLLDDQGLFRGSLGRLLASEPDLEIAGGCATPAEALEVLVGSVVDMVLLDFDIGTERGNDFIEAARQGGYPGRFLIVTASADVRNSAMALRLGASGIFLKSDTPDHLVQAIRIAGRGGGWVDRGILQLLADQIIDRYPRLEHQNRVVGLDDRERSVLRGIVDGLTNRKIADNMGISESLVKNVVQSLFRKTSVRTRGQLVRIALEGALHAAPEPVKRQPIEMQTSNDCQSNGQLRLGNSEERERDSGMIPNAAPG